VVRDSRELVRATRVLTQDELGHAAKLHRTHIGFLEQGRRDPSLSTLLILAETLEIPARADRGA
jgi:DNA-binding XRE family transcriptional regulator